MIKKLDDCQSISELDAFLRDYTPQLGFLGGRIFSKGRSSYSLNKILLKFDELIANDSAADKNQIKKLKFRLRIQSDIASELLDDLPLIKKITQLRQFIGNALFRRAHPGFDREALLRESPPDEEEEWYAPLLLQRPPGEDEPEKGDLSPKTNSASHRHYGGESASRRGRRCQKLSATTYSETKDHIGDYGVKDIIDETLEEQEFSELPGLSYYRNSIKLPIEEAKKACQLRKKEVEDRRQLRNLRKEIEELRELVPTDCTGRRYDYYQKLYYGKIKKLGDQIIREERLALSECEKIEEDYREQIHSIRSSGNSKLSRTLFYDLVGGKDSYENLPQIEMSWLKHSSQLIIEEMQLKAKPGSPLIMRASLQVMILYFS